MGWGGSNFYKDVIPATKKHLKIWASDSQLLPTHSTPTSPISYAVPQFCGPLGPQSLTSSSTLSREVKHYCLPEQCCGVRETSPRSVWNCMVGPNARLPKTVLQSWDHLPYPHVSCCSRFTAQPAAMEIPEASLQVNNVPGYWLEELFPLLSIHS